MLLGLLVSVLAPVAGSVSAGMWAAMAIALAGIGWLWIAALRRQGPERPGRITLALAMTLIACSGILWLAEAGPGPAPYGLDLAEYLYFAAAPLLWLGMLQLDRANSHSAALPRTTLLLDMLVLTISGAAFSWYFLMGHYSQHLPTGPAIHITEIMPYVNIALYGLFSWLLLRPTGSAFSGRQLGFIITVMAANSFLNLRFLDVLQGNTIASFLLIVAIALLILDAHTPARRDRRSPRSDRQRALTIVLAPYIAAFSIVVLLIISTVIQPAALLRQDMLFWSTLLAFTVVIVRQILTILDNQRLLGSLVHANRTLRHRAEHDALTGLPNRHLLERRLGEGIARADLEGSRFALLFIDVDDFKQVNDKFGHDFGDAFLQQFSVRLLDCVPPGALTARLGGDEFIVLWEGIESLELAHERISRLHEAMDTPYILEGIRLDVGVSLGVAFYPGDGDDAYSLRRHAGTQMYASKRQRKSGEVSLPAM